MKLKFFLAVTLSVTLNLLEATADDPDDSLILGNYKLKSDPKAEDFAEFLGAMEYSTSDQQQIRNNIDKISVEIKKDGDEYSYVIHLGAFFNKKETFKLGDVYTAALMDGRKYQATVTMSGAKVNRAERHDGFQAEHEAEFSKDGFNIKMKAKDVTCEMEYERTEGKKGGLAASLGRTISGGN